MTRDALEAAAIAAFGRGTRVESVSAASGGCIHACYLVSTSAGRIFVKLNAPRLADAFAAEADGLTALRAGGIRAPEPIAHGTAAGHAYLALELLELGGREDFAALGRALAALHRSRVFPPRYNHRKNL